MANKNGKKDIGDRPTSNQSTKNEKSIYGTLKEIIGTDTKVYYIMFKYCPEFLGKSADNPIKTFEDLHNEYACFTDNITEKVCEKYLTEELCQTGITWLMKKLHHKKLVELYNLYFDKAKEDVQAFKAFQDFSEKFFAETKENDLTTLLSKIPEKDLLKEEEDLSYTYEE